MNTINASTGSSGFQLRMGRSPRIIPPLVVAPTEVHTNEESLTADIITCLELDVAEAQDNPLTAKMSQAEQANKARGPNHDLQVGNRVKLTTAHHCAAYINTRLSQNTLSALPSPLTCPTSPTSSRCSTPLNHNLI
ncbi:hypothetical protein K438DRAFT_2168210 [Mycena galopus ATCC 62051]|nr:hypothetical protein K438DRAFT_2168210 [Mycena galopus ATCC 62051]